MDDDDLRTLIARATEFDGTPPFSDGALLELAQGKRRLVWETDGTGTRIGAALDSPTAAEFVIDPDARGKGHGSRMLDMLTHPARHGAGAAKLFWAHGDHPAARILAEHHRLVAERELLHLEAEVPTETVGEISTSSIRLETSSIRLETRSIRLGEGAEEDAAELLDLNARAFVDHPDQGDLSRADLDLLMAAPWFDAEDLRLLRDDAGTLIGFVWLKVDEFYVVAVSPERQGEGLGRKLMDVGFARLASKGIQRTHLYVEGDNAPALALYRALGFTDAGLGVQYHYTR